MRAELYQVTFENILHTNTLVSENAMVFCGIKRAENILNVVSKTWLEKNICQTQWFAFLRGKNTLLV